MKIEAGMIFIDTYNRPHYVVNVFMDGDHEIVTHRYYSELHGKSMYVTNLKVLFLMGFDHGLLKWKENGK